MRAVLTRVLSASVTIDGEVKGSIGNGYLILLGIHENDEPAQADKLVEKICNLRIFEDENGKMNLNIRDAGYNDLLIISQFTLFADCKSRRPGFSHAARPEKAVPLYENVLSQFSERGYNVQCGTFGADMKVASVNDGPVTILFDTEEL